MLEVKERAEPVGAPPVEFADRRRFTIASLIGLGVATVPYLWVLWDRRVDPLNRHPGGFFTNFYDLQARALFDGHWYVPRGTLGIEAFVIDGKHYTYFPPFPSLLRMPILAVTDSLDGRLTAPSMLLSWLVTGLLSALLVWRVRVLLRGNAPVSRGEAISVAVFLATVMSGSVLLYLASLPWVYHEAFAWGAAMTIGALFALLGVFERPTIGGVAATGAFTLAAVLSRTTIGWGCVIAILLAAIWFAVGRGGESERRWWLPLVVAGLVPLFAGFAITWVKFGTPFIHPLRSQVWTQINAHRREALDANGGSLLNVRFLPTTALAYFRPDGLRLSSVFPFITLPPTPPRAVGDVVVDQTYRTASIPTSMPLLFLLSIWGMVTAFRPRPIGRARLTRIALLGAAAGTGGVLFYGYIAPRYLGDFAPLLVLAGAVGLVDLWRRFEGRERRVRGGVVAAVAALGVFGLAAHLGITTQVTQTAWEGDRVRNYIETQDSIGGVDVDRGEELPRTAPADELFVAGDCAGLYLSTGERESPRWLGVEYGPGFRSDFDVTFHEVDRGPFTLMTVGNDPSFTVSIEDRAFEFTRWWRVRVGVPGDRVSTRWVLLYTDRPYRVSVTNDPGLHRVLVSVNGEQLLGRRVPDSLPVTVETPPSEPGTSAPVTWAERRAPEPSLCRSLID